MKNPAQVKPTVVVAMSGGVDSSVTAALLKQQGYQVIGMMLRLWSEPGSECDNRCCTPDAMAQARRVAALLDIPFYAVDAKQYFRDTVVQAFLDGYAQGITPNPCLVCNRQVRWHYLLERALALGAEYMATGHYVRLERNGNGHTRLRRAVDEHKDQSYVLHVLNQDQLKHALFPLGEYTKPQVRQLAHQFNLPVAERADSQDLCFLGKGSYQDFLARHAPQTQQPGPIVDQQGNVLGQHHGLANFTIGQRKGIKIAAHQPYYVLGKNLETNSLIVGDQATLGGLELIAHDVNWLAGSPPDQALRAQIKTRYTAQLTPGWVTPIGADHVEIRFDQPQREIAPGQAAVFYQDDYCLGGGAIQNNASD